MRKVMAFGTFDLLHKGHLYYLQSAKQQGDFLIVVVARDKNVAKFKGKAPIEDETKRLANIKKLEFVDTAVLGSPDDMYSVIDKAAPDIVCLGYDQKSLNLELMRPSVKIVRIDAYKPEKYKSSVLRNGQ